MKSKRTANYCQLVETFTTSPEPSPIRQPPEEIVTLYLEGYLTPEIALKTKHSNEAVDRYIRDYHRVEILWKHGITDLDKISQLTRLSKRMAHQYVDLLPDKLKKHLRKNKMLDSETNLTNFNLSGETEVGPAEESGSRRTRDTRSEGNDREDRS